MKKLLLFLAATSLVGTGCITIREPGTTIETQNQENTVVEESTEPTTPVTDPEQTLITACQETAGTYDATTKICTCTVGDNLDTDSGECLTTDNVPNGTRGEKIKNHQIKSSACIESNGAFDDETEICTCPTEQELGDDGKCKVPPTTATTE